MGLDADHRNLAYKVFELFEFLEKLDQSVPYSSDAACPLRVGGSDFYRAVKYCNKDAGILTYTGFLYIIEQMFYIVKIRRGVHGQPAVFVYRSKELLRYGGMRGQGLGSDEG